MRIKQATISIRTSEKIKERLAQIAEANGRSLNQEVESRLERSFRDDDVMKAVCSRLWGLAA